MLLKISWYKFKLECYKFKDVKCNPHGNHKEFTKKEMVNKFKYFITKKSN